MTLLPTFSRCSYHTPAQVYAYDYRQVHRTVHSLDGIWMCKRFLERSQQQ
jgi:hypothetical protein